jgi:hypothetical protein
MTFAVEVVVFAISGTNVNYKDDGLFVIDDPRIVDNGDGTYEVLEDA